MRRMASSAQMPPSGTMPSNLKPEQDISTMFLYNNLRYKAEMLEIAIYPALEYQDNKHEPLCA